MDLIERQTAIEAITYSIELCNKALDSATLGGRDRYAVEVERNSLLKLKDDFKLLPSAQPEIIYCKDCVKHNKGHGYYCDGMSIGIKDCCPLVEIRGRAQGHEFDYQFCAYAERRQDV